MSYNFQTLKHPTLILVPLFFLLSISIIFIEKKGALSSTSHRSSWLSNALTHGEGMIDPHRQCLQSREFLGVLRDFHYCHSLLSIGLCHPVELHEALFARVYQKIDPQLQNAPASLSCFATAVVVFWCSRSVSRSVHTTIKLSIGL